MQISKQRLIQIIKEELQTEDTVGMPLYGDKETNMPSMGGASLCDIKTHMLDMLSGLDHDEAVDVMMDVASELKLLPPQGEEGAEGGEYGGERPYAGYISTRENIEEMIANELIEMLKQ